VTEGRLGLPGARERGSLLLGWCSSFGLERWMYNNVNVLNMRNASETFNFMFCGCHLNPKFFK
jgi:hypothetical protein